MVKCYIYFRVLLYIYTHTNIIYIILCILYINYIYIILLYIILLYIILLYIILYICIIWLLICYWDRWFWGGLSCPQTFLVVIPFSHRWIGPKVQGPKGFHQAFHWRATDFRAGSCYHQWEISRVLKWRYVSTIFLSIFWGYIPLHSPKK